MSIRMIFAALAIMLIGVSAPTARGDEASKEKIISEIFEVMQYEKLIDQMFEMMNTQIAAQMKSQTEDLGLDLESVVSETSREVFEDLKTGLKPLTTQLWTKYYTEAELAELLAFYRSDVGRKSIEITPQMTQEIMAWTQQATAKAVPRISARVAAAVKDARGRKAAEANP